MSGRLLRLGSFDVDLKAGEIRKHGRRLRVQEKPFQLLQALLERPGDVISREELRERLWPADTFVDFDNGLNNSIRKLRRALSDSAQHPRYVETVGRRGYRFIASIENTTANQCSRPRQERGGCLRPVLRGCHRWPFFHS